MASYGATGAAGIRSDDFSLGSLDTWWTTKTEGTATTAFEGNNTINFTIPNDQNYDWSGIGNFTYYGVEQAVTIGLDFEIEASWTQWGGSSWEICGIGVYDGTRGESTRVGCYANGANLEIFGNTTDSPNFGSATITLPTTELKLRLKWVEGTTTVSGQYKADGGAWTNLGSGQVWAAQPDFCVLYSGRSGASTGWTSKADYFWETSAPITGGPPPRRVMVR